jgi:hypothetical protein
VPPVGEGVAAGVAEHVRMRVELEAGGTRCPLHHTGEAGRRERGAALAYEEEGRRFALLLEPPQGSQFVTHERMSAGGAVLDPADVEHELDLSQKE